MANPKGRLKYFFKKKKTDIYQRAINKSLPNPEEDCIDDEGSGKLCYVLRVNHPIWRCKNRRFQTEVWFVAVSRELNLLWWWRSGLRRDTGSNTSPYPRRIQSPRSPLRRETPTFSPKHTQSPHRTAPDPHRQSVPAARCDDVHNLWLNADATIKTITQTWSM